MTHAWQIRPAEPRDAAQILSVTDEATAWLVDHGLEAQWGSEPPSEEASFVTRVSDWIRDGEAIVAVDEAGDVDGYMVAGCLPPPYLDAQIAQRAVEDAGYVYTLASRMTPESRGVGRALLDWADVWARGLGVAFLRLDCWADDPALRAYYEKQGFLECDAYVDDGWRGIVMERRI
jgi:GNAT superfamily N-acetyltransferase